MPINHTYSCFRHTHGSLSIVDRGGSRPLHKGGAKYNYRVCDFFETTPFFLRNHAYRPAAIETKLIRSLMYRKTVIEFKLTKIIAKHLRILLHLPNPRTKQWIWRTCDHALNVHIFPLQCLPPNWFSKVYIHAMKTFHAVNGLHSCKLQ